MKITSVDCTCELRKRLQVLQGQAMAEEDFHTAYLAAQAIAGDPEAVAECICILEQQEDPE
jgi:hypothetical protein